MIAGTERKVAIRGKLFTLAGPELRVGDKAPDFGLVDAQGEVVKLSQSAGKIRLIASVHSVDTPICDLEAQRFNTEAATFSDVVVYVVSMDLPFALARYCSGKGITNLKTLTDYREASFGAAYGVLIKERRLLARATFVVDRQGTIRYAEYLPEVGQHPDYDRALAALKAVGLRKAA
ncbi:MAG: thiol peroxidase [Chloroflexi bacterium]|nr:thiol peroxidase [Chloroflexota bacterium]